MRRAFPWVAGLALFAALTAAFVQLGLGLPTQARDVPLPDIPRDVPGQYLATPVWASPAASQRGGGMSSAVMAASPDGSRLYTVNTDPGTITIVDLAAEIALVELNVGREPRTVALYSLRPRAYVTNLADSTLTILDVARGVTLATVETARSPYGVVVSPTGARIYVSATGAHVIQEFDAATLTLRRTIPVAAHPRGLAIDEAGETLYVTHFLDGRVSVIGLARGEVEAVISTGAESSAAQFVAIHPRQATAYLPHTRSRISSPNVQFDTLVAPLVSVIDLERSAPRPGDGLDLAAIDRPVNLPFALDFSPDGRHLYVVNSGSNDLSVVDLDGHQVRGHIELGANPRGIIVAADGAAAYVLNALSYDVSVVDLERLTVRDTIAVSRSSLPPDVQRGKELFFSSDTPDLARDQWVSCASCHFEGLHDGRTWPFDDGPRNTPPILGLAESAPFHWLGDRFDLFDFQRTVTALQGGTGLSSADNAALAAFLAFDRFPASPHRAPDGSLTPQAIRGQELFAARGCGACHAGPAFTDGRRHDVGTDNDPLPAFDTPSLLGLFDTAPYLHDGSAPALRDVLTIRNPVDRHGRTADLEEHELDALIAFLVSLPGGEVDTPVLPATGSGGLADDR